MLGYRLENVGESLRGVGHTSGGYFFYRACGIVIKGVNKIFMQAFVSGSNSAED